MTVECPECGGNCAPDCGMHPMGCTYGGFSYGYWIVVDGCPLDHGEGGEQPAGWHGPASPHPCDLLPEGTP